MVFRLPGRVLSPAPRCPSPRTRRPQCLGAPVPFLRPPAEGDGSPCRRDGRIPGQCQADPRSHPPTPPRPPPRRGLLPFTGMRFLPGSKADRQKRQGVTNSRMFGQQRSQGADLQHKPFPQSPPPPNPRPKSVGKRERREQRARADPLRTQVRRSGGGVCCQGNPGWRALGPFFPFFQIRSPLGFPHSSCQNAHTMPSLGFPFSLYFAFIPPRSKSFSRDQVDLYHFPRVLTFSYSTPPASLDALAIPV